MLTDFPNVNVNVGSYGVFFNHCVVHNQVAVFPPLFRTLKPPPLELYDLDAEFSSEKNRLAQLTNRCNESDLEYYIIEAGHTLNIISQLKSFGGTNSDKAKQIVHFVMERICQFKKSNQF